MEKIANMKDIAAALLQSLFRCLLVFLTLAVLELASLLIYFQAVGTIDRKFLIGVPDFFVFYGVAGAGVFLISCLLQAVRCVIPRYRGLTTLEVKAWEYGMLAGTIFFLVAAGMMSHHVAVWWDIQPEGPMRYFIYAGFLMIGVGLSYPVKSAVQYVYGIRLLKTVVIAALASLTVAALSMVLYWQDKLDFIHLADDVTATAELHGSAAAAGLRPNVLLITIDALRADHLSSYGYTGIQTKNIDYLAEKGVLFEQMIAQSPWTRPSFGSIWSSLYPSQNMLGSRFDPILGSDAPTIAELLADSGYITIGLNTTPQLDKSYGFDKGFQLYIDLFPFHPLRFSSLFKAVKEIAPFIAGPFEPDIISYLPADKVCRIFDKVLERLTKENKPFYFWIHFMDPHLPYNSHRNGQNDRRPQAKKISMSDIEKFLEESGDRMVLKDLLPGMYEEEILFADRYIGVMTNILENAGLLDGTMIVLTSDHGEELFDHGGNQGDARPDRPQSPDYYRGYDHGHTMYEELVRIPLIIKLPDAQHAGTRIESIAQHVDILPTIAAVVGITDAAADAGFQGVNLLRCLKNEDAPETRYAKSEYVLYGSELKQIRSTSHKLIYHSDDQSFEFYDLLEDPRELIQSDPDGNSAGAVYPRMVSALNEWMVEMPAESAAGGPSASMGNGSSTFTPDQGRSEELKERLEALGYVQ